MQDTPYLSAKQFRRRVFRPVEGVFLFHPRAWERLIQRHLDETGEAQPVPPLEYFLMPRAAFLTGLEDENPEALSVIEGIDLPELVILLTMPSAQERSKIPANALLQRYWAKRVESEGARDWELQRRQRHDREDFGAEGLRSLVGPIAFQELRTVLTGDKQILPTANDEELCRHFVGLVARMRLFSPGQRPFWFPAVADWEGLDDWMCRGGLSLDDLERRGRVLDGPPYQHPPPVGLAALAHSEDPDWQARPPTGCPLVPYAPPSSSEPDEAFDNRQSFEAEATNTTGLNETHSSIAGWLDALRSPRLSATREPMTNREMPGVRWVERAQMFWSFVQFYVWQTLIQVRGLSGRVQRYARNARVERVRWAVYQALRSAENCRYAESLAYLLLADRHQQALGHTPEAATRRAASAARCALSRRVRLALQPLLPGTGGDGQALENCIAALADANVPGHVAPRRRILDLAQQAIDDADTAFVQFRWWRAIRSLGRQPLRAELPFQGRLRALRALRMMHVRWRRLPWSPDDLEAIRRLMGQELEIAEGTLRVEMGPALEAALDEVGFTAQTPRERVAFAKIRDELLDLLIERGRLTFIDLRDVIARNELRLPDPTIRQMLFGDRLNQLDGQLARVLPGIYQRGEFYIRGLQQLSAPLFGSSAGRWLTRYMILPFGIAFLGLEGLNHLLHWVLHLTHAAWSFELFTPIAFLCLGVVLNLAFYTNDGRSTLRRLGSGLYHVFKFALFTVWHAPLNWPWVRALARTAAARKLLRFGIVPMTIGGVLALPVWALVAFSDLDWTVPWLETLGLMLASGNLLRNTHVGKHTLDSVVYNLDLFWSQVRTTLFVGLIRSVLDLFDRMLQLLDAGLQYLGDLVRFRGGETLGRRFLKILLAPLWNVISFFVRLYVTVLVEPQVNPIKHFPVVTVAHKLILPLLPTITLFFLAFLDPFLPRVITVPLVAVTIFLLPGLFGFLVWELKENWRLYRANAHPEIAPAVIGHHGETMRGMLHRGFHSGTVPKAYARLRHLLDQWLNDGHAVQSALHRAQGRVDEALQAIVRFTDRELARSLAEHARDLNVSDVTIKIAAPDLATQSVVIPVRVRAEASGTTIEFSVTFWIEQHQVLSRVHWGEATAREQSALGRLERLIVDEVRAFCRRGAAKETCSLEPLGSSLTGRGTSSTTSGGFPPPASHESTRASTQGAPT